MRSALVAAAAATVLLPAAAAARPVDIQPIRGVEVPWTWDNPEVRFNARGDGVLAFQGESAPFLTSRRASARRWRPLRRLFTPVGDSDVAFAIDVAPDGGAVVAWSSNDHTDPADPGSRDEDCCERVGAVVLRPDGRFAGRPRVLSPRGVDAFRPVVAAASGGRYAVSWTADRWAVRRAGPHGRFGAPHRLPGVAGSLRFEGRLLVALGVAERAHERLVAVERRVPGGSKVVSPRVRALELTEAAAAGGAGVLALFHPGSGRTLVVQRRPGAQATVRRVRGFAGFGRPRGDRLPVELKPSRRHARFRVLRPARSSRLGREHRVRLTGRRNAERVLGLTASGRFAGLELAPAGDRAIRPRPPSRRCATARSRPAPGPHPAHPGLVDLRAHDLPGGAGRRRRRGG